MKQRTDSNVDREIKAQRRHMMNRLTAMSPKGEPQGWYATRLRERVMATIARHFGGRAR